MATAAALRAQDATGRTVVAIDTLRAATTAEVALAAGAREIWPVRAVEAAFKLRERLPAAVLGGERALQPVAGFDAGNSPFDYTPQRVGGRPVVLTTTNGTLALSRARRAEAVAFAGLTSAPLAAAWLKSQAAQGVLIVLSGTDGHFSFEDALTAGAIAQALPGARLDDLMLTCLAAYRSRRDDLLAALRDTPHARRLEAAGYAQDVEYAASHGAARTLPVRDQKRKGRLIAWQDG